MALMPWTDAARPRFGSIDAFLIDQDSDIWMSSTELFKKDLHGQ